MALINWTDVIKQIEVNTSKNAELSDGTNTSVVANKLVDTGADFVTDLIKENMIVKNRTTGEYSYVTAVDDLNTLTLNDNIFLTTDDIYYVYDYEDMNVLIMEEHITRIINYVFDRLRKTIATPETTLLTNSTVQMIAIDLATCKIGKIIYRFFSEVALENLTDMCTKAEEMLDKIISGDIQLDITDNDDKKTQLYSESINGEKVFKMTSYDGSVSAYDTFTPSIDIME